MGIFDTLFPKKSGESTERQVATYFKTLNAYTPVYTSFEGGVYEMALTKACIHSFANHCAKLKPEVKGAANPSLERKLQYKPNPFMDTKKYIYRLATSYKAQNNVGIIPLYADETHTKVSGFYPVVPMQTSVVDVRGKPYLKFQFASGQTGAIELERAGWMNQFQYHDDFFGDSNACLSPTLELLNARNQSIITGVKNSANVRFLAKLSSVLKPKDLKEEQKRLVETNLNVDNNGGVMVFDEKYESVTPINSTPYIVDDKQAETIRESVFDYFGTNADILQNKFTSSTWSAYYEGQIEPFAIEASLVHTNMAFTETELAYGNEILFTVNRLQYLEPKDKLEMVTGLFDRGMLNADGGLEIFQMSSLPNNMGKKYYIRRDYAEINALNSGNADSGVSPSEDAVEHNEVEGNEENAD